MNPKVRAWLVDTGERVLASFGEAVVAAVAAGALAKGVNADTVHVVLIAGLTAGATVLKAALASIVGGTVSPASLAPAQQPGQAEQQAPPSVSPDVVEDDTHPLASVTAPALVRTVIVPEEQGKGGRLGRHIHHDERSRAYRVAPVANPRSVTWKRHVKPFDQGSLGSCTGNAMAGALSTAPFGHRYGERRAVALYEAATRLDDVPGSFPPDDTGSSGLAVAQAAKAAGLISSYNHCFNLDDVIAALQSGPVIAGTNWHTGMDTPDRNGLVTVKGAVRGGHEYELLGVDLDRKLLVACNSWGTTWGNGGYFAITFADFTRLLAEQGDVTVPLV